MNPNPNEWEGFRWTPQDDLIALRLDLSIHDKAALLGRSSGAVVMRRMRMRQAGHWVPATRVYEKKAAT